MRRASFLLLAAVLLVSVPAQSLAGAERSLALAWDDCYNEGNGGGATKSFACDTNEGDVFKLIASVVPPLGMLTYVGQAAVFDLQTGATALPDWWRIGACRVSSSLTAAPNAGGSSCLELVDEEHFGGLDYAIASQGNPRQARLRTAFAFDASRATALTGGEERALLEIRLDRSRTAGPGACAGCGEALCIVLNSVLLDELDTNTPRVVLTSGPQAMVLWQSPGQWNCITPTKPRTWGQLKSLYR